MINLHVLSFVKRTGTIEEPSVLRAGSGDLKQAGRLKMGHGSRPALLASPIGMTGAREWGRSVMRD